MIRREIVETKRDVSASRSPSPSHLLQPLKGEELGDYIERVRCTDCHGARLAGGAPNHLVTYDDLVAPSEDEPTKTIAEVSLARMKATNKPMPPDGGLMSTRRASRVTRRPLMV